MKQLISDETKFKKLTQNPTKSREDSLITYLRKLKRDGIIDDEHFTKYCHLVPRMVYSMVYPRYINLVAHFALLSRLLTRITITLRPILFGYFNLSQLTSLLSRTPSPLQNGPSLTNIMANICVLLMPVRSSPTFPLDETIQICLDKLYALANPPKLPRSVLKDLLVFATKRSHFLLDGQYYDQFDGVAMGSPLGPVLANIFMCDFEGKWVMNNGARPTTWFRYVDDTFTLFPNKDTAVQFLSYLNTRHKNIQFTTEFEQDEEIPFLDVLIKRQPNNSLFHFHLLKENFHWPLHSMGFFHASKIQS